MAEPEVKLYYFNFRAKCEFIRLVLAAGGMEFEDIRIDHKDWGPKSSAKKETPYGQLPYMIYKGKKYAQSIAIATFFAKKLGFYPKTDEDCLRQDEVIHLVDDIRESHLREWYFEKDPEKLAEKVQNLKTELFPRYLGYFEAMLAENGGTGFFVGDSVTLADIVVYDILETCMNIDPEVMGPFPFQQKLRGNVEDIPALKAYVDKRPKTHV